MDSRRAILAGAAFLSVLAAGCGGGGSGSSRENPGPVASSTPAATPTPAPITTKAMVVTLDGQPVLDGATFHRSKWPNVTAVTVGIEVSNLHASSPSDVTISIGGVTFPVLGVSAAIGHVDFSLSPSWVQNGTYPILLTDKAGPANLASPPVAVGFAP